MPAAVGLNDSPKTSFPKGGYELLQQEGVVALDGAGQEVLGGGGVLPVPDVQEHLLRGLEEAVRVLIRLSGLDLAFLPREGYRPFLVVAQGKIERPRGLDLTLLEQL